MKFPKRPFHSFILGLLAMMQVFMLFVLMCQYLPFPNQHSRFNYGFSPFGEVTYRLHAQDGWLGIFRAEVTAPEPKALASLKEEFRDWDAWVVRVSQRAMPCPGHVLYDPVTPHWYSYVIIEIQAWLALTLNGIALLAIYALMMARRADSQGFEVISSSKSIRMGDVAETRP